MKSSWLGEDNELGCKLTLRLRKYGNFHYVMHASWEHMNVEVRQKIFYSMYQDIMLSTIFIDNGSLCRRVIESLEEIAGEK